jgi:hypothetical protein
MRVDTVLFVSAGMAQPKKRDHPLARRQLYLNYGALTLATQLARSGRSSRLVHGGHETPDAVLDRLVDQGLLPSAFPVMLSMPSFYTLGWTQVFCHLLRAFDPSGRIIIGGRWVTGPDPDWLGGLIPEADRIVPGLGEPLIAGLIDDPVGVCLTAAPSGLPDFGLDHTLVEDFLAYQASVETSRGCGMGCAFCEERDIPLSRLREPELLAAYMADVQTQYRGGPIRPYLQSSFFVPNPRWASRMREIVGARGLAIPWRCETRVDAMKPETVEHLAAAGLKVIDLGLETASPTQIGAVNKSPNPDRYLRMASDLLVACRANGVWVKANVLLYGGETPGPSMRRGLGSTIMSRRSRAYLWAPSWCTVRRVRLRLSWLISSAWAVGRLIRRARRPPASPRSIPARRSTPPQPKRLAWISRAATWTPTPISTLRPSLTIHAATPVPTSTPTSSLRPTIVCRFA